MSPELKELQNLKSHDVFKRPIENQVVSTRFVFTKHSSLKSNFERYKTRLVLREFEFESNVGDTFHPTPHSDTMHFVIFTVLKCSNPGVRFIQLTLCLRS